MSWGPAQGGATGAWQQDIMRQAGLSYWPALLAQCLTIFMERNASKLPSMELLPACQEHCVALALAGPEAAQKEIDTYREAIKTAMNDPDGWGSGFDPRIAEKRRCSNKITWHCLSNGIPYQPDLLVQFWDQCCEVYSGYGGSTWRQPNAVTGERFDAAVQLGPDHVQMELIRLRLLETA